MFMPFFDKFFDDVEDRAEKLKEFLDYMKSSFDSAISGVTISGITVYLAPGRKHPPTWIKSVDPKCPLGQGGCALPMSCANPNGVCAPFEGFHIEEPVFVVGE